MATNSATLDPHDPNDVQDYSIDWSVLLAGEEETDLTSSSWSASSPPGLTVNSTTATSSTTTAWVIGGEPGKTYGLTNRVATVGGRQHDRTIYIPCKHL